MGGCCDVHGPLAASRGDPSLGSERHALPAQPAFTPRTPCPALQLNGVSKSTVETEVMSCYNDLGNCGVPKSDIKGGWAGAGRGRVIISQRRGRG